MRERVDVVEVVGRHVQLQRKGNRSVGLCPFHQEKSPSFHVISEKGIYYCFGCQASGDAFKFLMEIEGLSFNDAVKDLAGRVGVEVEEKELSQSQLAAMRRRSSLYDVYNAATAFYQGVLWTSREGQAGRDYLHKRGIGDELAKAAQLGVTRPGWGHLLDHLQREGFPRALIEDAGLATTSKDRTYDFFRDRFMIPIRDERGRIISMGGRDLSGSTEVGKYINSKETDLYRKSTVLYGFDMARNGVRHKDRILLVEGYFDVLSLHQAGFTEAVATCGTALTEAHVERIAKVTRNVIVLLDADTAGSNAAEGALPKLMKAGIEARRLQLPDAKDPDELVRERGAEAMEEALLQSTPLLDWVVRRKAEKHGYSAGGTQQTVDELLGLGLEFTPIQISHIAHLLRVREELLIERIQAAQHAPKPTAGAPAPPSTGWQPQRDVVHLLWLMVHRYDDVADVLTGADPALLDEHAAVRPALARLAQREPIAAVIAEELDPGVKRTLAAAVAREHLYPPGQSAQACCEILARIARPRQDAQLARLDEVAEAAKRSGDLPTMLEAVRERARINQVQRDLRAAIGRADVPAAVRLLAPPERTSG